jgi:hypothetical protein
MKLPVPQNNQGARARGLHALFLTLGMAEQGDVCSLDQSEAFRLAHRDAGQNKPLYLDHPQFEGFQRS